MDISTNQTKVFLDANIVIGAGKPPGGPLLVRLKYLVNAGLVTVVATDLTFQEVAKKHAEDDYKVIKEVGRAHFRNIVKRVLGTKLPEIKKTELKAKITESYQQSTKAMFEELNCKILPIDNVKPSVVFSSYTAGEGFFTGEGKKDQFPDAFIFECLKTEASKKEPIIIVSNDRDFEKPVEGEPHISLVKSLPELFESMGLRVDAPGIEDFLETHVGDLSEAVNDKLDYWGLIGDVEDSEIERVIVTEVETIELISFGSTEERGSILVVGRLQVNARISYTHPDWDTAVDTGDDIFVWNHVSDETEVNLNMDVSMSVAVDKNNNPEGIEELRFLSDDFRNVELYPNHFYD